MRICGSAPRSSCDHLQPRDGRHRRILSHTPMSQTLSPLSQGGPPRTNTSKLESREFKLSHVRTWDSPTPCFTARHVSGARTRPQVFRNGVEEHLIGWVEGCFGDSDRCSGRWQLPCFCRWKDQSMAVWE